MNDYKKYVIAYLNEYFGNVQLKDMPDDFKTFYNDLTNKSGIKWYFNRLDVETSKNVMNYLQSFHKTLLERKNIFNAINEYLSTNSDLNEGQIYDIRGLTGLMARMGYDDKQSQDALFNILKTAYQNRGNQGVIDTFKDMSGTEVSTISNGRFTFDKVTGQEDQNYRATDYDYDNMTDRERRRMLMQRGHSE